MQYATAMRGSAAPPQAAAEPEPGPLRALPPRVSTSRRLSRSRSGRSELHHAGNAPCWLWWLTTMVRGGRTTKRAAFSYRSRPPATMLAAALMCVTGRALAACSAPPPVIVDIPGVAYYTDARRSARDQTLFQLNREALEPLDRYLSRIARMSDAFVQGDGETGRCTLAWLTTWAKEGALLGEPTAGAQARSQRRWSGAAMTLSALKVWDAASKGDRAVLRPYVSRLAQAVQRDATLDKLRNNLLYWAGLVYMATSWLTGDAQLRDQAVAICRDAIASLTPAGSLPLEDLRGDRAIDYNGFALFPLSVIATLNGTHGPGCSLAELRPLAAYVLAHRDGTSDPFLRWAPFMGMDVVLRPEALFYSYGGGSLHLVAEKLAALARARSP